MWKKFCGYDILKIIKQGAVSLKSRTIVFTEPYKAELIPMEIKELGADDVLVRMVVSSISSGTERANFIGEPNVSIYSNATEAVFPRIVGYSSAGIVEKVGENVKELKVGDRVAMSKSIHSEYMVLNREFVYKIGSEDISLSEAALWYIAGFPAGAIRKCRLEFGEAAIVMGQGILGMIATKLLAAAGAAPIIAVDPDAGKRKKALEIGADFAFDPFEEGFAEKVKKATGGGASVAIEVTGNGKALDQVLDCMRRFGRVALLGCTRESDFTIDYYHKVHGPGIMLIGAHNLARPDSDSFGGWWCQRDEIEAIGKLTECGRLCLSDLVEERHSPEDAGEVFTRLAKEKVFPISQFDWGKLSGIYHCPVNDYQKNQYTLQYVKQQGECCLKEKIPGACCVRYDKCLKKWHLKIQLDDECLWYLSVFLHQDGSFEKYSLDKETANDSHYEFVEEQAVRKKLNAVGEEDKFFHEILIRYVKSCGGNELLNQILPYVTKQFHF